MDRPLGSRGFPGHGAGSTVKILWVKAGKLLPIDTGGKIRSFNLLRRLQGCHTVTLLSYYFGEKDPEYEAELIRRLPGAVPLPIPSPLEDLFRGVLHYLRRLPNSAPYAVTKFTAREVRQLLAEWLEDHRFDVAVCDFLSASLNFPPPLRTPTVLFQHNVESVLWQRQAIHEPNPLKRWAYRIEAAKMTRYERSAVRRFQQVIAVSDEDREQMREMTDPSRITVLPTGVDLEQYQTVPLADSLEPVVLFLGSMDWEANIDGVEYFCREIWHRVLAEVPGAKFQIVGRNPHARVKRLASDSIEVTGTVPSVIEYLRRAAVFVVPLRVGGGTRLKIYEAMAMAKPVVSTVIGAEGLDVHDGENILLADDPEAFANGVVRILKDPDLQRRLGSAAVRLASRYDWSVVAERFADVLERAIRENRAATLAPVAAAPAGR
jgi:glycosyltransferase involved in cell wall biosynthesis